jgi:hypothetical protein
MHAAGIHPQPLPVSQASLDNYGKQGEAALDTKDPRNWPGAEDPITSKQLYRLKSAGFTDAEIGELSGKGEASVVVGAYLGPDTPPIPSPARARAAYDKVQAEAIGAVSGMGTSTPPRVAEMPSQTATPTIAAPQQTARKPLRPTQ